MATAKKAAKKAAAKRPAKKASDRVRRVAPDGSTTPLSKADAHAIDRASDRMTIAESAKITRERRTARVEAPEPATTPSYFASGAQGKNGLEFVSTGCSALDAVLGGGFVLGRCVNVVGDKSVGKTLLVMEAMTNFCLRYPDGVPRYAEGEAAFDESYAEALGAPIDRILLNGWRGLKDEPSLLRTVEDLYEDLVAFLDKYPGVPKLYAIDSLDSLSDDAEMEAEFDKDSMGGKKPKLIGQLFRRLVDRMEVERCAFVVVSQIRDRMNAKPFQETKTRSGGKALDFYASQQLWLTETGKVKRTVGGIERIVGVDVQGYVKKNKVGLAYRRVDYPVLFGYGIDDMQASVDYLIENKCEARLLSVGLSKAGHKLVLQKLRDQGGAAARKMREDLARLVHEEYQRIETSFLPTRGKYS